MGFNSAFEELKHPGCNICSNIVYGSRNKQAPVCHYRYANNIQETFLMTKIMSVHLKHATISEQSDNHSLL